jgi:hypothetical protein
MPTRIATVSVDYLDGVKALIIARPETIENGFRVLDADLQAGEAGAIDILGLDRAGTLTIVALAAPDLDGALLRILDQHRWVCDQRALLARAYSLARPLSSPEAAVRMPVRGVLVASCFNHAFLARLDMLSVGVTTLLARRLGADPGSGFLIEPAAPIFGLGETPEPGTDTREVAAAADFVIPETPSNEDDVGRSLLADEGAADPLPSGFGGLDDASFFDTTGPPLAPAFDADAYPEPLTAEELAEFERFERQRRGEDRDPS